MSESSNPVKNLLLASLPQEEYERLQPYLEPVALDLKQTLYEPNVPIEFVYFPLSGVVSLLTQTSGHNLIELATVGNDSIIGLPVFLGAKQTPGLAMVQVAGSGLRMRAEDLQAHVTPGTKLYELLHRYTQALFNFIAQTALCNRMHSIEQRCCRWMLLTQDRVGANQFPFTHEFLSRMLGVRRAGVTEVARKLQDAGFMSYHYGKITILDRAGLEATSCECYELLKVEFKRLLDSNNVN